MFEVVRSAFFKNGKRKLNLFVKNEDGSIHSPGPHMLIFHSKTCEFHVAAPFNALLALPCSVIRKNL